MSRNPFLDLGVLPEVETSLHIRSRLAAALERHIDRKGWSQAEASRLLRVPQTTISKIVNGNIEKLSIEFLTKLLARISLSVGMSVFRALPASNAAKQSMPKLTEKHLVAQDSKRDLAVELLQAVRQMKDGHAARIWRVYTNREERISPVRKRRRKV